MSNNSNNEEKEFQNQPQFQPLNNPRVIEIPVQHFTSPNVVPNTTSLGSNHLEPNNPDADFFNNRPRLFEDFNSPFDLLEPTPLRSRFNREPLSSRFDDFFNRPSLVHQQSLSQKPSLFDDPFLTLNGKNSLPRETFQQPTVLLKDRSNSTTQQPSLTNLNQYNNNSTTTNNNNNNNNNNNSERQQSPIFNQTIESPKTNTNVFQIPIHHIQTTPASTEIPSYINSDFKHQIPFKTTTESPIRQTTPPSFKIPSNFQAEQQPQQPQQAPPRNPTIQPVVQQQPSNPQVQTKPVVSSSQQAPQVVVTAKPVSIPVPAPAPVAALAPTGSTTAPPPAVPAPVPAASHTSTAYINLDSDFKQPLNLSTKYRSESPAPVSQPPQSKQPPVNKSSVPEISDFKQPQTTNPNPIHKIRSESPARQPTVIPLPPPPSLQTKSNTESQQPTFTASSSVPLPQQQQSSKTMGNLQNGQSSKKTNHAANDTTDNQQQSTFYVPAQPTAAPPPPKTALDRCDDIACELENLSQAIDQFNGNSKNDKNYLKLDEYLTRCFLKLDDIDRTDERVHQARRKLIHFTQQLVDKLEAKVLSPPSTAEAIVSTPPKLTDTSVEPTADNNQLPTSKNSTENDENSSKKENQKIETQNDSSNTAGIVLNLPSLDTTASPEKSNEPEQAQKIAESIAEVDINSTTVHSSPQ